MSITSAMLRRMCDFDLSPEEVVKLACFIECNKSGWAMVSAIFDAVEANPNLAPDYLNEVIAGLRSPPEPSDPANDRAPRMSSYQRKTRYAQLAEENGAKCCECNCDERTIWRRQGVWDNDWGQYTKVSPTTNLEVDHIRPLWAGGSNDLVNLWLLCIDCHKRKTAEEAGQRRRA